MLLNILSEDGKSSSRNADASSRAGEQHSQKIPLIYSCLPRVCTYKARILLVADLFLVIFYFCLILVVNSCRTQKVCRIRNAPVCHHLAQEAAGQDLEEIHSWGQRFK